MLLDVTRCPFALRFCCHFHSNLSQMSFFQSRCSSAQPPPCPPRAQFPPPPSPPSPSHDHGPGISTHTDTRDLARPRLPLPLRSSAPTPPVSLRRRVSTASLVLARYQLCVPCLFILSSISFLFLIVGLSVPRGWTTTVSGLRGALSSVSSPRVCLTRPACSIHFQRIYQTGTSN